MTHDPINAIEEDEEEEDQAQSSHHTQSPVEENKLLNQNAIKGIAENLNKDTHLSHVSSYASPSGNANGQPNEYAGAPGADEFIGLSPASSPNEGRSS